MQVSKRDELFSAIAVVVLLVGTASGSAEVILALSFITLAGGLIFFRPQMRTGAMRVTMVAAFTAILIAVALAIVLR